MSNNPHEIFVTKEDHWSWDKYIEQCDLINLSDTDKQRAKESYQYLRGVFGEGYLKRACKQGNPMFFWFFSNAANSARLSMIRFTDALKALERVQNYKAILKRIRRPKNLDDLAEGSSVIDVAHKFYEAGFEVEFEPIVSVTNHRGVAGPKKPDIKIVNRTTDEEIIVEVSRMKASDHQNLTERTFHVIWRALVDDGMHHDPEALKDILHPRYIQPYALIHRGLEEQELKEIVDKIRSLVAHVRKTGKFSELIIPDTIEVGIGPYDDHESAREWAAAKGLNENDLVQGPDILSDEIARAKVKLRVKLKQLPEDRPGIVVMHVSENLIFFVYDVRWIVAAMAEEVEKHPNLLCAIMSNTFTDGSNQSSSVEIGPHTFAKVIRSGGGCEQSLFVRNGKFNQPLSAETLKMVNRSFIVES
jgi:hypothetical protein